MQEDNNLRDRFENFSAEPRPAVWDRIEAELDDKPNRKGFIWWWSAAVVLLFGAGAAYVVSTLNDDKVLNIDNQENKSSDETITLTKHPSSFYSQDKKTNFTNQNPVDNSNQSNSSNALNNYYRTTNLPGLPSKHKSTYPTIQLQSDKNPLERRLIADPYYRNRSSHLNKTEPTLSSQSIPFVIKDSNEAFVKNENETKISDPVMTEPGEYPKVNRGHESKPSRWTLTLHAGNYRTAIDNGPSNFVFMPASEYNTGLLNNTYPSLEMQSASNYRHIIQSIGLDLSRQLSSRWGLRTGLNLMQYKTEFIEQQAQYQGASYFQLAMGADFTLLNIKKFSWQIGTGIGTGWLRNPVLGSYQNSIRTEWNVNTSLCYSISDRFALRLQPNSRLIISDTNVGEFGKLSRWYHGANIGLSWMF